MQLHTIWKLSKIELLSYFLAKPSSTLTRVSELSDTSSDSLSLISNHDNNSWPGTGDNSQGPWEGHLRFAGPLATLMKQQEQSMRQQEQSLKQQEEILRSFKDHSSGSSSYHGNPGGGSTLFTTAISQVEPLLLQEIIESQNKDEQVLAMITRLKNCETLPRAAHGWRRSALGREAGRWSAMLLLGGWALAAAGWMLLDTSTARVLGAVSVEEEGKTFFNPNTSRSSVQVPLRFRFLSGSGTLRHHRSLPSLRFVADALSISSGDFEFELEVPYLRYENATQEWNGSTIHDTCCIFKGLPKAESDQKEQAVEFAKPVLEDLNQYWHGKNLNGVLIPACFSFLSLTTAVNPSRSRIRLLIRTIGSACLAFFSLCLEISDGKLLKIDRMREMMNVGENRVQNGVLDCPESKFEENFLSVELVDSSRYAMERLRVLRGVAVQ
ncbi:hypothetical protein E3N88_23588 [Mikania micrantha]|uniref:Uncharacterized protein n=1 Tax=Mikania micrantha TaxID=192012 RepID=A0A5N6NFP8_9ASTR|nr:hypothetical protein E3N88_23588 [Mikania micrantha]